MEQGTGSGPGNLIFNLSVLRTFFTKYTYYFHEKEDKINSSWILAWEQSSSFRSGYYHSLSILRGQQQESLLWLLTVVLNLRPSFPLSCRCQKRRKIDLIEGISLLEMWDHAVTWLRAQHIGFKQMRQGGPHKLVAQQDLREQHPSPWSWATFASPLFKAVLTLNANSALGIVLNSSLIICNSCNIFVIWGLISPFQRWRNWGSERWYTCSRSSS